MQPMKQRNYNFKLYEDDGTYYSVRLSDYTRNNNE
jgi:hypothetical protein